MEDSVYNKVVKALANTIAKDTSHPRNLYVRSITKYYNKDGVSNGEYGVEIRDPDDPKYIYGDGHEVSWDSGSPNYLSHNG